MLCIGLTGGIGSGKSTVTDLFAQHHVPVIDADDIARQLAAPGQPAHQPIVDLFGRDILSSDLAIDRQKLRVRVFANPTERKHLEAILHPLVQRTIQAEVQRLQAVYCVISVPLLIEANLLEMVDRVLVIDAEEKHQIQRVMARNGMREEEVRQILASQLSRSERLRYADDCIVNNTDHQHLKQAVEQLHEFYLILATQPRAD